MFVSKLYSLVVLVMWCATLRSGTYVSAFSTNSFRGRFLGVSPALWMSTTSTSVTTQIIPRVKAADANEPTDGPVLVKGWVRTLRKQKTLAFVEVNDGSNLGGIQCVLPFNDIDDVTKKGKILNLTLVLFSWPITHHRHHSLKNLKRCQPDVLWSLKAPSLNPREGNRLLKWQLLN